MRHSITVKPRSQGWNSGQEKRLEGQQTHAPLPNLANIRQGRERGKKPIVRYWNLNEATGVLTQPLYHGL